MCSYRHGGMGNGDADMAGTNWQGEGTCMGRGMQKKKNNDGRQNGKRKSQQNELEIQEPTKYSHHIPELLTLQGLPHMSAHPRHMWVHRDNLIDYGRIL